MMDILLDHAVLLDKLLLKQIDNKLKHKQFSIDDIRKELNNDSQLTALLYHYIFETTFNNIPIVDTNGYPNGYYKTTDHTNKFIENGGFVFLYKMQVQELKKMKRKEELELKNLELGPKQHRFNKISVWVNAGLTLITIVLTVLIALGIIGKKN
jgi:hypothetical protein